MNAPFPQCPLTRTDLFAGYNPVSEYLEDDRLDSASATAPQPGDDEATADGAEIDENTVQQQAAMLSQLREHFKRDEDIAVKSELLLKLLEVWRNGMDYHTHMCDA